MKASDIGDVESFRTWIETRPKATRVHESYGLANRLSMRVLVLLSRSPRNARSSRDSAMYAFRCLITGRANIFSTDKQINKAAGEATAFDLNLYESNGVLEHVGNAARSSLYRSYGIYQSAQFAEAAIYKALDNYLKDDTEAARFWVDIQKDALLIDQGLSVLELSRFRIWDEVPSWFERERDKVGKLYDQFNLEEDGFAIWFEWYDDVAAGRPAFGLGSRSNAELLERKIALGGEDGQFHKEFWDREPGEINREIAMWVAEARAAEALALEQGSGLRFQYRNGLIALGKYLGLASPQDDRKRIESNLPQLADLADVLQAALDAREAPYPPLLLKTLSRFSTLVKSTPADIEPEHLHAATTLLRGQIESAAKPSATSNVPPLEDGELALAKSITMISDLVVMGTVRGKALFDDADRVSSDSSPDEKFLNLSRELFELVKTHGGIMDGAAVDLLLDVLISGNLAPHPKRFAFLQEGSAKNALIVFGAIGLLSIATPGAGALAFLFDKLVDVGIVLGIEYKVNDSARNKIDAFILQYENKLREIAKHKESLKWLDDVLYLREQHRKRRNDDLK